MQLTEKDVRRVADLARISLEPHEIPEILGQLNGIFGMVEQLLAVDTTGIEPMAHAQESALRLRADEITEGDQHALFQSVAPLVQDGLYLVPRVIE
jgi:aspartyl-tRNA(Asn)/glutamyl-tRNA(Gln) amidotransferase subunit C